MKRRKRISQRTDLRQRRKNEDKKRKWADENEDAARSRNRIRMKKRRKENPEKVAAENAGRRRRRTERVLIWGDCARCGARLLNLEPAGFCCKKDGKSPEFLIELPRCSKAYQFLCFNSQSLAKDCRKYNNLFAMSATGCTGSLKYAAPGCSNLVLMQGRIYHRMLRGGETRGPLRFFISDPSMVEKDRRKFHLDRRIVQKLRLILSQNNDIYKMFQQLHEEPNENARLELSEKNVTEIAGIIIQDKHKAPEPRSIVRVKKGTGESTFIRSTSALYLPLQYPLVCPSGTPGWSLALKNQFGITQLAYYRQLILRHKPLRKLGPLLNEFAIDFFTAVEEQRLEYLRHNQLRGCRQDKIVDRDTLEEEGATDPSRVYLPASFLGSRRHQRTMIADAQAIAARKGNPTVFLTPTCNPNWDEILSELEPGQTASDRPDVVARVFHVKKQQITAALVQTFRGEKKVYSIQVTEFQKRGLPHSHIAIKFLREPRTASEIDEFVCAELPEDPELRKIVETHMIHSHRPRCYRTELEKTHKKCRYGYPKKVAQFTTISENGYVSYRRRTEKDIWVVPYNSDLLRKFNCHINVEMCHSSGLIMYLYKYFYKGPDRAKGTIEEDEITQFIRGRYLSASEAMHRLFEFELTRSDPSVKPYPVHLPDQPYTIYRKGQENQAKDRISALQRYFNRPRDASFDNVTYIQYQEEYISSKTLPETKEDTPHWVENFPEESRRFIYRRTDEHIARLDLLRPQTGEVFYVRLLLQHKPARSFEDLKTVDNVVCATYSQAAVKLGLLRDNNEAGICFQEACDLPADPRQLRTLFVLLVNEGAGAFDLYQLHVESLIKDFVIRDNMEIDQATHCALHELGRRFAYTGKTLKELGLPTPSPMPARRLLKTGAYAELTVESITLFNREQKMIFDIVSGRIDAKTGGLFYIDGSAGTGKSYLLNALLNYAKGQGKVALACATTGFVAKLYEYGRTAHGLFGIPVVDEPEDFQILESNLSIDSEQAEMLRNAAVIIWDEFISSPKENFETAAKLMSKLSGLPDNVFGNIVFVAAGDVKQTLPIVPDGSSAEVLEATIFYSDLWKYFVCNHLPFSIRQRDDPEFFAFLEQIGNGTAPTDSNGRVELIGIKTTTVKEHFEEEMLRDLENIPAFTQDRAILSTLNVKVDEFNRAAGHRLSQNSAKLFSTDSPCNDKNRLFDEAFCNSINLPNIPPHCLELKVNMEGFLTRNLMPEDGLLNNTPCRITAITRTKLTIELLSNQETFLIPRISFKMHTFGGKMSFIRKQFPFRAGYAKTVNRAQGATIGKCGFDVREEPFAHGQLYVGLGRVKKRSDLLILANEEQLSESGFALVRNVVYPEVFALSKP